MSEQALSEAAGGEPMPEAEAEEVEQDVIAPAEEAEGSQEPDNDDAAFEADARKMGWVPESEWKGDKKPRQFVSAKEFLERGETILPIVNAENKRLKAEMEALKKEQDERFARMEKMSAKALERQKEKLVADFEARKREAVKLGDEEGYDAAEKAKAAALRELDEQADEPRKSETKDGAIRPADLVDLNQWREANAWFGSDEDLTGAMDIAFAKVSKTMSAAPMGDKLEAAREIVSGIYPEKFGKKIERRSGVESGARTPSTGGKLSAKLPAEARSAGQKFVSDGLYKDLEEYAKAYFED